jgi:hypothetical protein
LVEAALLSFNCLLTSLTSNSEEYRGQIDAVIGKAKNSLQRLNAAGDAAKVAHRTYTEAGRAVEAAYASNAGNYQELLKRFGQAQTTAINAHKEWNTVRSTVTTLFAEYLSDFERIEEARTLKLAATLKEFGLALGATAEKFGQAADRIRADLEFSDDAESKLFEDTNFLKDAAASVRYQAVPVPGEATQFLDMKKFFHAELKAGARLCEATSDFRGGVEFLDVVKSEIVCVVEDRDTVLRCKNVNECVGLVPATLLKPV